MRQLVGQAAHGVGTQIRPGEVVARDDGDQQGATLGIPPQQAGPHGRPQRLALAVDQANALGEDRRGAEQRPAPGRLPACDRLGQPAGRFPGIGVGQGRGQRDRIMGPAPHAASVEALGEFQRQMKKIGVIRRCQGDTRQRQQPAGPGGRHLHAVPEIRLQGLQTEAVRRCDTRGEAQPPGGSGRSPVQAGRTAAVLLVSPTPARRADWSGQGREHRRLPGRQPQHRGACGMRGQDLLAAASRQGGGEDQQQGRRRSGTSRCLSCFHADGQARTVPADDTGIRREPPSGLSPAGAAAAPRRRRRTS